MLYIKIATVAIIAAAYENTPSLSLNINDTSTPTIIPHADVTGEKTETFTSESRGRVTSVFKFDMTTFPTAESVLLNLKKLSPLLNAPGFLIDPDKSITMPNTSITTLVRR